MFSALDKSAQARFGLFVPRSLISCTFNAAKHNDIGNGRRAFTPLRSESDRSYALIGADQVARSPTLGAQSFATLAVRFYHRCPADVN
jgi:hypothetical protein